MEESGFDFDEFSIEMEDFEYKKVRKFDRIFLVGEGGSFTQEPLVHKGLVYVGSMDHNVYAINAITGRLVWNFKASDGILISSPVFDEGIIYIGSYDQNLYALDAATGRLVWKFPTMGKIISSACSVNGKVYFGSTDQNFYCLDSKTGRLIWKYRTQGEICSNPTFYKGKIFFGSYDHFLYCLDAETGSLEWRFETQGDIFFQPRLLVHDDRVYFPSFDNYLRVVDVNTGNLVWKFLTGSYGGMGSGPVLYKNVLYQANREGVIYALTMDGEELWRFRINNAIAHPLVEDDKIYFGSEDQNLYCIDLSGKKLWTFPTQGIVWWKPAIRDGKIYFTSWDCNLYCVDVKTHRLVWKFRGQGSPSYIPPPFESYELVAKKSVIESGLVEADTRKRYEFDTEESHEEGSVYKMRITYQVSTHYREKGKYQSDDEV